MISIKSLEPTMHRITYLRRVLPAYIFRSNSQLSFWHEESKIDPSFQPGKLGSYYMDFVQKAHYQVHLDQEGIPLLDYMGNIGKQYNPIAISQFALGHYNLFLRTGQKGNRSKFLKAADWLVANLKENNQGILVWLHNFDWEYHEHLKAPWYSGLAQGQGMSVLVRALLLTGDKKYEDMLRGIYLSFEKDVRQGGVVYWDNQGNPWIEEYITSNPTHILNGFIWALWGIYDYFLLSRNRKVEVFWGQCLRTLEKNLGKYDAGYWSLYDLSNTKMKNLASLFYHKLHIVQLKILDRLTGKPIFKNFINQWECYLSKTWNSGRAFCHKVIFKMNYF